MDHLFDNPESIFGIAVLALALIGAFFFFIARWAVGPIIQNGMETTRLLNELLTCGKIDTSGDEESQSEDVHGD